MDNYDEILEFYNNNLNSSNLSKELWINRFLIKLTKSRLRNHDYLTIKNSLILLLNLFMIDTPDCYYNKGKKFEQLTENEKQIICCLLKSELII